MDMKPRQKSVFESCILIACLFIIPWHVNMATLIMMTLRLSRSNWLVRLLSIERHVSLAVELHLSLTHKKLASWPMFKYRISHISKYILIRHVDVKSHIYFVPQIIACYSLQSAFISWQKLLKRKNWHKRKFKKSEWIRFFWSCCCTLSMENKRITKEIHENENF